jgi:hypothetical protein
MVFSYNARLGSLVEFHSWTSNDTHTTTADVYKVIGSLSVFYIRLENTFSFGRFSF